MDKKDLISIIIPVYNLERYIEECFLNSVIEQIYKNIEIVCVDNEGKDGFLSNSRKILDEHVKKDKRIKVFVEEEKGCQVQETWVLKKQTEST